MEDTLKQLEPADQFISCRMLLQRWSRVPHETMLEAVEGNLLIPLRYASGPDVPKIEGAKLPTLADKDGYSTVDLELAEELGVMFSLANVLLLEDRFPHVFPGQLRKQTHREPMDVIMALLADKENAQMEALVMRERYEAMVEKYLAEVNRMNQYMRYVDTLRSWVHDMRKKLSVCAGEGVQICDGQAFPRWLCDRRRKNVEDSETVQTLHKKFGFTQAAAAFMVKTPTAFAEEVERAEKGIPVPDENRRMLYVGIRDGRNKERKKKMLEDKKKPGEEDADEGSF